MFWIVLRFTCNVGYGCCVCATCWYYDCVCEESPHSTHPYLVPLHKEYSLPVMMKRSLY